MYYYHQCSHWGKINTSDIHYVFVGSKNKLAPHDVPESAGHDEQTTVHPPQVHGYLRVSAACQVMVSVTWCSLYETSSLDSVQTLGNAPQADSRQSCQKMKISKSMASGISQNYTNLALYIHVQLSTSCLHRFTVLYERVQAFRTLNRIS